MSDMNEESVDLTPAEENPWYQLYLLSREDEELS